jgi:hypothetical protein
MPRTGYGLLRCEEQDGKPGKFASMMHGELDANVGALAVINKANDRKQLGQAA